MANRVGVLLLLSLTMLSSACGGTEDVEPRVVEGFAYANEDGTAIGLAKSRSESGGESFIVAGADSRDGDGPARDGGLETCIKPGAKGQPVRLGLVRVEAGEGFMGRDHVVCVHCL